MEGTGNINIFFGKVVDITDENKINRVKVTIAGYTDEIDTELLPWYFPWYGQNYLPLVDDILPIIVFDENFSTAFYGNKVNLIDGGLEDDDYATYLELYKRTIDDKDVALTYKKSSGIEFINDTGKIQIEKEKLSLFVNTNSIVMSKDKINIGDSNQEATILGDKGVTLLHDIMTHNNSIITKVYTMFTAISAASTSPFTIPIGTAINSLLATDQAALTAENKKVDATANKIQSKKVFIE